VAEHKAILEPAMERVHKQFAKLLKDWPMSLLVVAAPRSLDRVPIFYRSDGAALLHEPYYYAVGSASWWPITSRIGSTNRVGSPNAIW
jgi:hypothetical protein